MARFSDVAASLQPGTTIHASAPFGFPGCNQCNFTLDSVTDGVRRLKVTWLGVFMCYVEHKDGSPEPWKAVIRD